MRQLVLGLLIFIAATDARAAGALDGLTATVVYLHKQVPDTVAIDGKTFEVGLREPGVQRFTPRMKTLFGTGFFIADGDALYLVTAKHVAKDMDPDSMATVRADLSTPHEVTLRDLSGWKASLHWKAHPTADVAVLLLRPTAALLSVLQQHFLPLSSLSADPPSRDVALTVLGFPLSFGASGRFSPISRTSSAASGLMVGTDGAPFLLLQDPSVGGFSGAPVFDTGTPLLTPGGLQFREARTVVVGLMSGTFSDETGGKLAAVVPAAAIIEALRLP